MGRYIAVHRLAAGAALSMFFAVIVAIPGFSVDALELYNSLRVKVGEGNKDLSLLQARLIPFSKARTKTLDSDYLYLQIAVTNIGSDPLVVTSASLSLEGNNENVRVDAPNALGPCTFSPNLRRNIPLVFEPGATKWLQLSSPLIMDTVGNVLNPIVDIIRDDWPRMSEFFVNDQKYIDKINEELGLTYGKNVVLGVVLYTREKSFLRRLDIPLSGGVGFLESSGNLLHDFMLETWVTGVAPVVPSDCTTLKRIEG